MNGIPGLCLKVEIGALCGTGRSRGYIYAKLPDFPMPATYTLHGQPLWKVSDVEAWNDQHRQNPNVRARSGRTRGSYKRTEVRDSTTTDPGAGAEPQPGGGTPEANPS